MRLAAPILLYATFAAIVGPSDVYCMQPGHDTASTAIETQRTDTVPSVEFRFERPGMAVPRYAITLREDAHGQYRGEQVEAGTQLNSPSVSQQFDIAFVLSPAIAAKIFALSSKLKYFNLTCASLAKNIAATGAKTLHYSGSDGASTSCSYDYSDNKDVQALTEMFQGVAETMDQGRRLDFLHRYDRLGLDHAMTTLASEANAGRALELITIAESLRSIADDAAVMQRVRVRATALLSTIPAEAASR